MSEIDVSKCDFYDKNKKYCLTLKMNTTGFKNPSCFSGDFQECIQDSKICPNTFCDNNHNCYYKQLQQLKVENEELKKRIDYCFEENSPNYDKFCDVCVAKDTCNGNCCYNQIKEMFVYEI